MVSEGYYSLEIHDNTNVCLFSYVFFNVFLRQMDPYAVNMMLGTSVSTHIFLLHTTMVVGHMQDPFLSFIELRSVHVGYCGPFL